MRGRDRLVAPHSYSSSLAVSVIYFSLDGSDLWKGDEGLGVVGGLQQRDQTEQEASTPLHLCRGTRRPTDAQARRR